MRYKNLLLLFILILFTTLLTKEALAVNLKFRRPLNTLLDPVYSAYYDNKAGSGLKDWKCGSKTYEGHRGTDFRATVGTSIYSGASGTIYYCYNKCPTYGYLGSECGKGYGNHVRLDHEGDPLDGKGWVSIYAHMKKGTALCCMSILCGTKIGLSGSSGNSSGPHLHFEVRKYGYPYDDPFAGKCSGPISFWVNQNNGVPTTQCRY